MNVRPTKVPDARILSSDSQTLLILHVMPAIARKAFSHCSVIRRSHFKANVLRRECMQDPDSLPGTTTRTS